MSLILPHSPYQTQAPEPVCVCVTWAYDGPVHVGLTESAERMNGIRPTCVIQLACGSEVCPHPSAGGDKEVGERGSHVMQTSELIRMQNSTNFTQKVSIIVMGSTTHPVSACLRKYPG